MYVERLLRAFGEEDPSPRSPLPGTRGEGEEDGGTVPKLGASPISDASGEAQHPTPLVEPLSARERDVLRLLVAGRSGPEIAEALVVAHSTVRTHLKSIYGKLDAHSRDQAIARARELKLV
jgi:ATP/maltotriose-dependent transcriptional regulator MalT